MNKIEQLERKMKIKTLMESKGLYAAAVAREISRIIAPYTHENGYSTGFGWDCPDSPFGYCVYNFQDDPVHDNCIFCGDPEERK